jgi:iron complex outermembrane receptor protein
LASFSGLALAQTATPTSDAVVHVEEIIVTATRREQALSDVPMAISAVGAQTLRNSGATDVRALSQLNPSLLVSSTGSESNTSARIRGVGTVGDNAGLESSVAIFIDGVYRSRTGVGMNELGEIERVEVLRGPQGTLFGRNASAGLLHIITKKPEFETHAYGFVTAGNYRYRRVEGGVTGPITQTLAGKIEGVFEARDGFYKDVNTGADDQQSRPLLRARPIAVGADRHLLGATDRRLFPARPSRAAARCSPPTRWPRATRPCWIPTSTPPSAS